MKEASNGQEPKKVLAKEGMKEFGKITKQRGEKHKCLE